MFRLMHARDTPAAGRAMLGFTVLRAFCAAFVLVAALIFAAPVGAVADANPAASDYIRVFGAEALKDLTDPATPRMEREARFRRLLVEHFDLAALSKFALGRHWRSATDSQRVEFKKVLEDFIVHSYSARFGGYRGVGFQVVGSANDAGGAVIVHSRARTSKTEEILIDWHLRTAGNTFVVADIVVEGVSMAVAQRSDFGSIIHDRGGIDGLIETLRARSSEPADSGPVN
jgi:phospholipid transport system substrate-binding protein